MGVKDNRVMVGARGVQACNWLEVLHVIAIDDVVDFVLDNCRVANSQTYILQLEKLFR